MLTNDKDSHVKYKIPESVKRAIPQHFPIVFAGELRNVFGPSILIKDKNCIYGLSYIGGTGGWEGAFKAACQKLNIDWLLDYYSGLTWYDSDLFDAEMEEKVISEFIETD